MPLAKLTHGPSGVTSQRLKKIPGPPSLVALPYRCLSPSALPSAQASRSTSSLPPQRPIA